MKGFQSNGDEVQNIDYQNKHYNWKYSMTTKNDLYVYRVNHGSKRVKKYKLSVF